MFPTWQFLASRPVQPARHPNALPISRPRPPANALGNGPAKTSIPARAVPHGAARADGSGLRPVGHPTERSGLHRSGSHDVVVGGLVPFHLDQSPRPGGLAELQGPAVAEALLAEV